jgi:nucleotide-binding universal stress UspA family protein
VVEVVAPGDHEPGVISYLDEHRIQVAQDYVTRLAAQLGMESPPSADACIAAGVAPAILTRAQEFGADLIVIASHGESWPAASALDSVAAQLTHGAKCPVLIIGPEADVPHVVYSIGRPALSR